MSHKEQHELKEKVEKLAREGILPLKVDISHGDCGNFGILKSKYVYKQDFYLMDNIIITYNEGNDALTGEKFINNEYYVISDDFKNELLEKYKKNI